MGLTDQEIKDITLGWFETMEAVGSAILAADGYTWSLMPGQTMANASPQKVSKATCAAALTAACKSDSSWQQGVRSFPPL